MVSFIPWSTGLPVFSPCWGRGFMDHGGSWDIRMVLEWWELGFVSRTCFIRVRWFSGVLLVRRRYISPSLFLVRDSRANQSTFLHLPPFLLEPIAITLLLVSSFGLPLGSISYSLWTKVRGHAERLQDLLIALDGSAVSDCGVFSGVGWEEKYITRVTISVSRCGLLGHVPLLGPAAVCDCWIVAIYFKFWYGIYKNVSGWRDGDGLLLSVLTSLITLRSYLSYFPSL